MNYQPIANENVKFRPHLSLYTESELFEILEF